MAIRRHSDIVVIDYTNWRGERRLLKIRPIGLNFGASHWHPQMGWMLTATDFEDGKQKDFAMSGIHSWNATPLPTEASDGK